MNPFTLQGKAIPSSVRQKIIQSWLEGKGPSQIGKELRLQKQTIANIVDNFVRRGNADAFPPSTAFLGRVETFHRLFFALLSSL